MSRRWAGLAVFAVALVVAAGVAFWLTRPSSGAADVGRKPDRLPAPGSCWTVDSSAALGAFPWPGEPVDCAVEHTAEVFYHNQVDPALVRAAATAKGDDAAVRQNLMYAQARRTCTVLASTYLGGSWHATRVRVIANWVKPQQSGYFGCALVETADPAGNRFVRRTGSLKGAGRSLAIDCVNRDGPALVYVPCAQPHDGEFVGTYTITPPDAPFDQTAVGNTASRGCTQTALSFLALPSDAKRDDLRAGYVGPTSATEWLGSDQTFACYALALDGRLKGSLKSLGSGALPRP